MEKGNLADLSICDANPLDGITNYEKTSYLMKDGKFTEPNHWQKENDKKGI